MKHLTHKLNKLIAAFEIIGGAIGIVMGVLPLFRLEGIQGPTGEVVAYFAICLGFAALYGVSLYAGVELWKEKRIGYTLSIFSQALQVPMFASSYVIYNFFSAISLSVLVSEFGPSIKFLIGNSFSLGFVRPDVPLAFGLNLVALAILVYLVHKLRKNNRKAA